MARRNAIPRTDREAQARERALATLARMRREKSSLSAAAKAEHTNPRTVKRYVGSALRREDPRRQYRATAYDRITRELRIPTPEGVQTVVVRDSRQATKLAEYWVAVHRYLETGDASALQKFRGKHITDASGRQVPLLTDLDELDGLGNAGVLSFESLYARTV